MLMAFFSWWYGAGWRGQVAHAGDGLARLGDTFSLSLLLRTLFSPFRQISAGSVGGPIGVQMRAFFDKTISRFIGAFVRSAIIVTGSIVLIAYSTLAVVRIILWPVWPVVPVIVIGLWIVGWTPWI